MRTLITHGYFLHQDAKEREIMKPYPPLGILYLSAHLRRHGVEPEIYDSTFGSREDLNRILHDGAPGIIGVYGTLMRRRSVLNILATARDAGWKTRNGRVPPGGHMCSWALFPPAPRPAGPR
jgi:hypothetical protein